jgi:vacuolar-type H+-ATPase subunit I/STV1
MNSYQRLVNDLKSGELNLTHVDLAVMEWLHSRPELPEGIKNLLAEKEGGGIIRSLFKQMKQTIGNMELAYRRGTVTTKNQKNLTHETNPFKSKSLNTMEENKLEQLEERVNELIDECAMSGDVYGCAMMTTFYKEIKPLISSMLQAKDEKIKTLIMDNKNTLEEMKRQSEIFAHLKEGGIDSLMDKFKEVEINHGRDVNEELKSQIRKLQTQLQEKESEIAQLKKELEDKKAAG